MKYFFSKFFAIILFGTMFCALIPTFALEKNISGAQIVANGDELVAERRIGMIENFLLSPWISFSAKWLSILIDINQKEPRGQIRGKNMKLSAHVIADDEFLKLFTHEFGHFVDIYLLRASKDYSDPSLDFYKINWQTPYKKYAGTSIESFISGYSATNQYEDFAETFVWYVFHNDDFIDRAFKNDDLRKKYLFFADNVFVNWEFQWTDFSDSKAPDYFWDTTKQSILLQKYLSFLISSIY